MRITLVLLLTLLSSEAFAWCHLARVERVLTLDGAEQEVYRKFESRRKEAREFTCRLTRSPKDNQRYYACESAAGECPPELEEIHEAEEIKANPTQQKQAIEKLAKEWGFVRMFHESQFRQFLLMEKTVLGIPFFNSVEISGDSLHIWTVDPERVTLVENWSMFADISDMFTVWCSCVGTTTIGFDARHLGGNKQEMLKFHLNLTKGRSEIAH